MADSPDVPPGGASQQPTPDHTDEPPPASPVSAPKKVTLDQINEPPPASPLSAPKRVTLDQITRQTAPGGNANERVIQIQIGGRVATLMVVIILIVLCLIAGYGWISRPPSFQDLAQTLGNDKALESYKQVQASWFQSIKDLIQILLVSLLVPFLTTVIAFIFGRQVGATDSGSGGNIA